MRPLAETPNHEFQDHQCAMLWTGMRSQTRQNSHTSAAVPIETRM
jgi:hypothetical protein